MSKTFLELVNEAIDESKVSLDALTSSNFASPPRTVMYARFKRWVNNAYKELFLARNEWYFRKERATLTVWPRLHLAGLSAIPAVGNVLVGDSSGVTFTIKEVHTFEDVEVATDEERTFSVDFDDDSDPSNLILRETFTNSTTSVAAGYLKGWGRYDFRSDVTQLDTIDPDSVRVFNYPGDESSLSTAGYPVSYIPWDKWDMGYELSPWGGDYPLYITETPQGTYDFYPKPPDRLVLAFDFSRKIPQMSAYNDIPSGLPEEYHDYLIWKAVEEYADFDNNPRLYSRAQKKTRDYWNWMDRDQKQEPRFADSKFSGIYIGGGWWE